MVDFAIKPMKAYRFDDGAIHWIVAPTMDSAFVVYHQYLKDMGTSLAELGHVFALELLPHQWNDVSIFDEYFEKKYTLAWYVESAKAPHVAGSSEW